MDSKHLIKHMPDVNEYYHALNSLSERWNLLALLGQMSNIGMDMTETREGFQQLTDRLMQRLGRETLAKLTSEMEAKTQVAVDIVIRNLFERTADIGFLATDDDIREFIQTSKGLNGEEDADKAIYQEKVDQIVERFGEYVAKYSVYYNIVLLDTDGVLLAQLDQNNTFSQSKDPLIQEALNTNAEYVECYKETDLQSEKEKCLIYAYRVTENNDPASTPLGVLCLMFRFENEMSGIFQNLMEDNDRMEITLLDSDGYVISSSDPYHIPIGAKVPKILDKDCEIIRFSGREYFAKTTPTQGYEGFKGLGWYGHVMVPLEYAFHVNVEQSHHSISDEIMQQVVAGSTLFSDELIDIPRQADRIQSDLDNTVWNGNVQIANTKSGDNSFSKTLLNEISKTGEKTKQVFEKSIADLNQTVISSYMGVADFHASLAVDIMDRNLYERANDCRWWSLNSSFINILAKQVIDDSDKATITSILKYINNLYTVYTNLFIFDKSGAIVAVSNDAERHLIGRRLSESWVSETLSIRDTQSYAVSSFEESSQYGGKHTYIYGASILDIHSKQVHGGIGIVFDSEPQFEQMLLDAMPRNDRGELIQGGFSILANPDRTIISSTDKSFPIGSVLDIEHRFFALDNGKGVSDIIQMKDKYYVVGSRMSGGYREYKINDNYRNDVVALVFVEIGSVVEDVSQSDTDYRSFRDFKYPQHQVGEETVELSTFVINNKLYALESKDILCSLRNQEITPMPGSDPRCLGIICYQRQSIPIISLKGIDGFDAAYDKQKQSIILIHLHGESDQTIGLVVDRVIDSPEVPKRALEPCDKMLYANTMLTRYVVQPEQNNERNQMLLVLDMNLIGERILSESFADDDGNDIYNQQPLLEVMSEVRKDTMR